VLPPLLDRFFGPAGPWSHERQLESIRRDIEWLFTSPAVSGTSEWAGGGPRVESSVVRYGVASLWSLVGAHRFEGDGEKKAAVEKGIARALAAFEPRLRTVKVEVDAGPSQAEIRINVRAALSEEPGSDVLIETVIKDRMGRDLIVRTSKG